jgi:hypothetical protein
MTVVEEVDNVTGKIVRKAMNRKDGPQLGFDGYFNFGRAVKMQVDAVKIDSDEKNGKDEVVHFDILKFLSKYLVISSQSNF